MKYIRTKNGEVFTVVEKIDKTRFNRSFKYLYLIKEVEKIDNSSNIIVDVNVVGEADTIEELCDGFWWENTMYKEPIFIPNYGLVLDRVKAWKENDKELNDNSFDRITIYGSIYIHGYGWKHVCKVNKSEERLELL